MDKFEGLDEAFETVSEIVPAEVEEPKAKKPPIKKEEKDDVGKDYEYARACLLYTSPSPRDQRGSRMPSSA